MILSALKLKGKCFFDALLDTFDWKTYSDVALFVGLNSRSIDRTIKELDGAYVENRTRSIYKG